MLKDTNVFKDYTDAFTLGKDEKQSNSKVNIKKCNVLLSCNVYQIYEKWELTKLISMIILKNIENV